MRISIICAIVALSIGLVMSKPGRNPIAVDKFVDTEVSLHADAYIYIGNIQAKFEYIYTYTYMEINRKWMLNGLSKTVTLSAIHLVHHMKSGKQNFSVLRCALVQRTLV